MNQLCINDIRKAWPNNVYYGLQTNWEKNPVSELKSSNYAVD